MRAAVAAKRDSRWAVRRGLGRQEPGSRGRPRSCRWQSHFRVRSRLRDRAAARPGFLALTVKRVPVPLEDMAVEVGWIHGDRELGIDAQNRVVEVMVEMPWLRDN